MYCIIRIALKGPFIVVGWSFPSVNQKRGNREKFNLDADEITKLSEIINDKYMSQIL